MQFQHCSARTQSHMAGQATWQTVGEAPQHIQSSSSSTSVRCTVDSDGQAQYAVNWCTKTNIAKLHIDTILSAYVHYGIYGEPTDIVINRSELCALNISAMTYHFDVILIIIAMDHGILDCVTNLCFVQYWL